MLLLVGFVVLATLAASLIIVERSVLGETQVRLEAELLQSLSGFRRDETSRFEHLVTLAVALESNPSFRRVRTAGDHAQLVAFLREIEADYDCDLILTLGPQGRCQARSDETAPPNYSLATMPGVKAVLEDSQAAEYWQESGQLYEVAMVPILGARERVEGCVLVGNRLDQERIAQLARDAGCPLAIISADRESMRSPDAPTLSPEMRARLPRLRRPTESAELRLPNALGIVAPLGQVGSVVLYRDLAPTHAFLKRTRIALAGIGLMMLALAMVLSAPVVGRVTEPMELFQTVFGNVPDGLCHVDRNLVVQQLNPAGCRLLGCTAEKAIGRPLEELADFRPPVRMAQAREEDGLIATRAGAPFAAAYVVVPIHDGTGAVVVFRDIGPVKAMQRELVDASRLAGMADLATSVLHNVGNAMNSVNVSSHLLTEKLEDSKVSSLLKAVEELQKDPRELAEFLTENPKGRRLPGFLARFAQHLEGLVGSLGDETNRLRGHVDHIQHLIRVQQSHARHTAEVAEPCNLAEIVEQALSISSPPDGVEVEREFAALPPVRVDRHKLLEILVNLIRNALEAMTESPRLTLRLRLEEPDTACIEVQDNGMGIAPENLTRIFQTRFTTKAEGHGFGLHSSANAATELGGQLSVESAGVGRGATFFLRLPA